MNVKQNIKGFTIIEVVLVLAIAGLIFLMVFIALPALQGGQRDGSRKNDASAVLSAVNTYISGNRGKFPTTTALSGDTAADSIHGTSFRKPGAFAKDVSTNTEAIRVISTTPPPATVSVKNGQIIVVQKTTCGDTGTATDGTAVQQLVAGTTNQYTVTTFLEGGGGVSYCAQS